MGTAVRVELWHEDEKYGRTLISKVMDEMRRIDRLMSSYRDDSEISQLNKKATSGNVSISQELFNLIEKAIAVSVQTNGAFDITTAGVGHLYDYPRHIQPDKHLLYEARRAVNYRFIELEKSKNQIHFTRTGVRIDLGGIAKGYAIDKSIQILQENGVRHALVSAGGDSRIIGDRMGRPWHVGIKHPRAKGELAVVLPLSDKAISTSGDYERFFIRNGVRYHHIINPVSGSSADLSRSVSVIGVDATTTDALATSLFVMGKDKGLALVESLENIEAIFIDQKGDIFISSGLKNLMALPTETKPR